MELQEVGDLYSPKNKVSFESLQPGSAKKVWWQCERGHEWEQAVRGMLASNGCPVCSGRKILIGFNDLATLHPELAAEWNNKLNAPLTMADVSFGSTKKVWWIDSYGHEWEDTIAHRIKRGSGCPVCAGRKVIPGVNDVLTLYPHLRPQVSEKNTIDLSNLSAHSSKKVWWKCEKDHHWQVAVDSRTKKQATGCPYCSNKKTSKEYNANLPDDLRNQWHPIKNGTLTPNEVSFGSNRRVWWQCEKGHEWLSEISKQVTRKTCPICFGRKILPGFNDLATTHPHLVSEWDTERNSLTPQEVKPGSEKKIWWKCPQGHSWQAMVNNRTRLNQGCPSCWSARFTSRGEEEIVSFLREELRLDVQTTVRTLIPGREIDIYLPTKGIAIEFNGVYWHSEAAGKGRQSHYKKWLACKEMGIQLIQVWEDEWREKPTVVKKMLSHKLDANHEISVSARKTTAIPLTQEEIDNFLLANHIQGTVHAGIRYGLLYNNKLVAVIALKRKKEGILELLRFATSVKVPGGFSKLLRYVEKEHPEVREVETFSDHCVSDGRLYEQNGFVNVGEIPPDYMYVVKGTRRHKFNYRIDNFRRDPNLLYEEGLTERELSELNKLPRIWDAGKTKWRITYERNLPV